MRKSMTTIMMRSNDGLLRPLAVHGYHWEWDGFTFVIHRPADPRCGFHSDGWVMTETCSGKRVSSPMPHKTRNEAIQNVSEKLDSLGVEKFRRLVAANLDERRDAAKRRS